VRSDSGGEDPDHHQHHPGQRHQVTGQAKNGQKVGRTRPEVVHGVDPGAEADHGEATSDGWMSPHGASSKNIYYFL
jgi:hypothetical protein